MKTRINHVLILGGSSDIGIEVVKYFLKNGWLVSAHYNKNSKKLKNLRNQYSFLEIVSLDFNKINESNYKKNFLKKFNKSYDSIINLIGYIDNKNFYNTKLSNSMKSILINGIIPLLIIQNIIPFMIKRKFGRILNCSSIGIKYGGGKNTYNYSLSKHTSEFIPNVYKDWARKNVYINNLRIGVTNTKIHKNIKNKNIKSRIKLIPAGRMAQPYEIAKLIYYLASTENTFCTGETYSISGGE